MHVVDHQCLECIGGWDRWHWWDQEIWSTHSGRVSENAWTSPKTAPRAYPAGDTTIG